MQGFADLAWSGSAHYGLQGAGMQGSEQEVCWMFLKGELVGVEFDKL